MQDGHTSITRRLFCTTVAGSACLPLLSLSEAGGAEPVVVRYFSQGYSPALRQYLIDVLQYVLDKTDSEFGPYRMEKYDKPLSPRRAFLEVEQGRMLNATFASSWTDDMDPFSKVIRLSYPVFFGLLGLRSLIASTETHARLGAITRAGEIKGLSMGQGENWPDADILKHNGLRIVKAQQLESLFPMLDKRRFDLLPLSVLEADEALAGNSTAYPQLSVNSDARIFYPFPFSLFINRQQERLAERFKKGLDLALEDGSLQHLFKQHFRVVSDSIERKKTKLMMLSNPMVSAEENKQLSADFMKMYGQHFEVLR